MIAGVARVNFYRWAWQPSAGSKLSDGQMKSFTLMIVILAVGTSLASAAGLRDDPPPSLIIAHKQNGIILNLACKPISGAHITLTNKNTTHQITSASDGKFVVDLPNGDYSLFIAIDGRKENKSNALFVQRAKNGDVRLLVNTGVESTCPCFEADIEDLLITVQPVVINSQPIIRKPPAKP